MVATVSQELRSKLRTVPAVPIVHLKRAIMILEPPSDVTLKAKEAVRSLLPGLVWTSLTLVSQMEEKTLHPSAPELASLPSTSTIVEPPRKKKKGPKGPNPLSVKKKKSKPDQSASAPRKSGSQEMEAGAKRKRDDVNEVGEHPSVEGSNGHKRKRRRKTHEDSGPVAGDE